MITPLRTVLFQMPDGFDAEAALIEEFGVGTPYHCGNLIVPIDGENKPVTEAYHDFTPGPGRWRELPALEIAQGPEMPSSDAIAPSEQLPQGAPADAASLAPSI